MIIVRAPLRISLGGGGTDLPSYYQKYGGAVTSAAINKYIYISVNQPLIEKTIKIKYSLAEEVTDVEQIKNELVKECLKLTGIQNQIEIHSVADLPSGTGLGSSGTFLVALLEALHTYKHEAVKVHQLGEEACKIEIDILKRSVGKRDQFMAAYGGITQIKINKKGVVKANKLDLPKATLRELENSLVLFYTGLHHDAGKVLSHQNNSLQKKDGEVTQKMHFIYQNGLKMTGAIKKGEVKLFGKLLNKHWQAKRQLSSHITLPEIDYWYQKGLEAGALGGAIIGAGGGGFLMFCCPSDKTRLRKSMAEENLEEMFFNFDMEGVKVIANLK